MSASSRNAPSNSDMGGKRHRRIEVRRLPCAPAAVIGHDAIELAGTCSINP